jgi:hypothetical protein
MAYTKLDHTLTDSTIWQAPDTTRLVWITMLSMADQNGYVGASVPGLAGRARVSIDACVEALAAFEAPDPWSRTKDNEGRRIAVADGGWVLLNHAKYRAAQNADDRRERSRLAMQALRAKRKEEAQTVGRGDQKLTKLAQEEAEEERRERVVVVGGSKGEDPKPPAPAPSDPPPAAAGKPAAPTKPRKNGQRLPEDWQLPKAWGEWALAEFPHWTADKVRTEAAKFRDHWTAKPGADATKLDWLATWRNWCRSDIAQRDAPRPPNGHAAPTATTPTPQGAVFVPPPPLSPEERAAADAKRLEVMGRLRPRRSAAS